MIMYTYSCLLLSPIISSYNHSALLLGERFTVNILGLLQDPISRTVTLITVVRQSVTTVHPMLPLVLSL